MFNFFIVKFLFYFCNNLPVRPAINVISILEYNSTCLLLCHKFCVVVTLHLYFIIFFYFEYK